MRLRPERANHVRSYDFVKAMTHDGRALSILVVIDPVVPGCARSGSRNWLQNSFEAPQEIVLV